MQRMVWLIATDEAGYGPNLGPLVIAATVWQSVEEVTHEQLSDRLCSAVTSLPQPEGSLRTRLADSKQVYRSGGSLSALEEGVLAACDLLHGPPIRHWQQLCRRIAPEAEESLQGLPWFQGFDPRLPVSASTERLELRTAHLRSVMDTAGLQLRAVRARLIGEAEFNRLVSHWGNKSCLLSHATLHLVRQVTPQRTGERISILCDKHGGRNRYGSLLQHYFPEQLVEVWQEGAAASHYRWGSALANVECRFLPRADQWPSVGLASMVAKYLRELAMRAVNHFWCHRHGGLRPTAGYPVDARRFKREIACVQHELGIPDEWIWRER